MECWWDGSFRPLVFVARVFIILLSYLGWRQGWQGQRKGKGESSVSLTKSWASGKVVYCHFMYWFLLIDLCLNVFLILCVLAAIMLLQLYCIQMERYIIKPSHWWIFLLVRSLYAIYRMVFKGPLKHFLMQLVWISTLLVFPYHSSHPNCSPHSLEEFSRVSFGVFATGAGNS